MRKSFPDDAALKNALPLVNYENVTLEGDRSDLQKMARDLISEQLPKDISQTDKRVFDL